MELVVLCSSRQIHFENIEKELQSFVNCCAVERGAHIQIHISKGISMCEAERTIDKHKR